MKDALHAPLTQAILTLLRPLIRILLRNGVPYGIFAELAKQVYVELALTEFQLPGRKPSVSRAAVITGLTRKDVQRLQHTPTKPVDEDGVHYHRAARVVSGWVRDECYRDEQGAPAVLPLEGSGASFAGLVRRYSGDMPPRAVLDELERVGTVERQPDGRVQLLMRAYIPQRSELDKLEILGNDVRDLIATINHNLQCAPPQAWVQRTVAYDNLPQEFLSELRPHVTQHAQALLEDLDQRMAAQDRDVNPSAGGTGRTRAAIGIYYYEESLDSHEESLP